MWSVGVVRVVWDWSTRGPRIEIWQRTGRFMGDFWSKIVIPVKNDQNGVRIKIRTRIMILIQDITTNIFFMHNTIVPIINVNLCNGKNIFNR